MIKIEWDWFNEPNKKLAILSELKPMIKEIINKFNPCEIVTSPEIAVILDETDLLDVVSSEDCLFRENGEELCYVIMDEEYEDDIKVHVYIDRKMAPDLVLFRLEDDVVCELTIKQKCADNNTNKMERRNCCQVIAEMMAKIPTDRTELIKDLKWNYEDASYKAPEETLQWHRTQQTLMKHLPKPTEEWEFEILSIFTTQPIETIKNTVDQMDESKN